MGWIAEKTQCFFANTTNSSTNPDSSRPDAVHENFVMLPAPKGVISSIFTPVGELAVP